MAVSFVIYRWVFMCVCVCCAAV